jgi:hypothetical protein
MVKKPTHVVVRYMNRDRLVHKERVRIGEPCAVWSADAYDHITHIDIDIPAYFVEPHTQRVNVFNPPLSFEPGSPITFELEPANWPEHLMQAAGLDPPRRVRRSGVEVIWGKLKRRLHSRRTG